MRWLSFLQTETSAVGRRHVLRRSAAALALPGTAAVGAGRTGRGSAPTETAEDGFGPSTTRWSRQQKLTAPDGDDGDLFGRSTAISSDGKTALVGAPNDEDPNGALGGSTYVLTHTNGEWSYQQKVIPDDNNNFGVSVSLSDDGTTTLIGAPSDQDPNGDVVGSTYVFTDSPATDDDGSHNDGDRNLSRFDTNDNGVIEFNEVLAAIAAHTNGTQIGSEPVDFTDVLAVISAHNNGTQV